jgi:hypothetical protein
VDVVVVDNAQPTPAAELVAASDGSYRACGLPAGDYNVFAMRFQVEPFLIGNYDQDGDGQPDTVALTASEPAAVGIDIRLQQVGAGPPGCGPGIVRGYVTKPGGGPAGGAMVSIVGLETGYLWSVTADSSGAYEATGLCADSYSVHGHWHDMDMALEGDYDADGDGIPDLVSVDQGNWTRDRIDVTMK